MAFDSSRVDNNAAAIESHLTEFAGSVTSVEEWSMVPEGERAGYVIVTLEYTP